MKLLFFFNDINLVKQFIFLPKCKKNKFIFYFYIIIILNIINDNNTTYYCMNRFDFRDLENINSDIEVSSSESSYSLSNDKFDYDQSYISSSEFNDFLETYRFKVEDLLKLD